MNLSDIWVSFKNSFQPVGHMSVIKDEGLKLVGHMGFIQELISTIPTHEPNEGPPAPVKENIFIKFISSFRFVFTI